MKIFKDIDLTSALLTIRREHHIRQEDLAKMLGISAMYVSLIENGKREMKISLLERWANALNHSVEITLSERK